MAGHGLGGAYRDSAIAEEAADCVSFEYIANRRRGSVGIDVADVGGLQLRVTQRVLHDAEAAFVLGCGLRDVVGGATHAVADYRGQNGRAPALGAFEGPA